MTNEPDFSNVATNEDISAIAAAIRSVTRSSEAMTIPQMPERLLDIRVLEYQKVTLNFDTEEAVVVGTYDADIKHMFLLLPASNEDAEKAADLDLSVQLEYDEETGVLALVHDEQLDVDVDFVVLDFLLASTAESSGYLLTGGAAGGLARPKQYDVTKRYKVGDLFLYSGAVGVTLIEHTAEPFSFVHNRLFATRYTRQDGQQTTVVDLYDAVEALEAAIATKQATLVSGENIKTVAGKSILGPGDLSLSKSDVGLGNVNNTSDLDKPISNAQAAVNDAVDGNIETLSQGLQEAEQDIQELGTELSSISGDVDDIKNLLPAAATPQNKLADKAFVRDEAKSRYEIIVTGDSGTLTDAQFYMLLTRINTDNVVVVCDDEVYYYNIDVSSSTIVFTHTHSTEDGSIYCKKITIRLTGGETTWYKGDVVIVKNAVIVQSTGYITLDDTNSTAVPTLTAQQVTDIYNAITSGKVAYIKDYVGTSLIEVVQKVSLDNKNTIYCVHLGRLLLSYAVSGTSVNITYKEVFDKSYLDGQYAPLSFVSNLYGTLNTGNIINLLDTPPTASSNNILQLSGSTNTEYDWNNPSVVFVRRVEVNTTLSKTNSLTFTLKYKVSRSVTISWGAKIQYSTNNQDWEDLSSNQSFNAITITDYSAGISTDITVFMDAIVGAKNIAKDSYIRVLLFKKQGGATALTTNLYFGVTVDNAYVCTVAQFNFTNIGIDTNQIEDGAVTKAKLSDELKSEIDGKVDKTNLANEVYGTDANGGQTIFAKFDAIPENDSVLDIFKGVLPSVYAIYNYVASTDEGCRTFYGDLNNIYKAGFYECSMNCSHLPVEGASGLLICWGKKVSSSNYSSVQLYYSPLTEKWYSRGRGMSGTWSSWLVLGATWGSIAGTLNNQTDLKNALNAKLDKYDNDAGYVKVYAESVFGGGRTMINVVASNTNPSTLAYRNANGNFFVGNPTQPLECANKTYVDSHSGGSKLYRHTIHFRVGAPDVTSYWIYGTVSCITSSNTPLTVTDTATQIGLLSSYPTFTLENIGGYKQSPTYEALSIYGVALSKYDDEEKQGTTIDIYIVGGSDLYFTSVAPVLSSLLYMHQDGSGSSAPEVIEEL